jgi:hypothetical protein
VTEFDFQGCYENIDEVRSVLRSICWITHRHARKGCECQFGGPVGLANVGRTRGVDSSTRAQLQWVFFYLL